MSYKNLVKVPAKNENYILGSIAVVGRVYSGIRSDSGCIRGIAGSMRSYVYSSQIFYDCKRSIDICLMILLTGVVSCVSTQNGANQNHKTEKGSGASLMDAIEQSADKIAEELPNGSRKAITTKLLRTATKHFSWTQISRGQNKTLKMLDSGVVDNAKQHPAVPPQIFI